MFRLAAALAALLLAATAAVADPPEYYRVAGVAAGDVLNVRLAPDSGAEIVGGLAPGAGPVEVGARDASGRWGRIVYREFTGWVSMRYLAPMAVAMLPDNTLDGYDTALPVGLACVGTEPFWYFTLDSAERLTFASFDYVEGALGIDLVAGAAARAGLPAAVVAGAADVDLTATIRAAACSDGMSDATYPMSTAVLVEGATGTALYEGCCHLPLAE